MRREGGVRGRGPAATVTRTPDEWSADIHNALVAELGPAKVDAKRFYAAQPTMTVCELERPAYEHPDGLTGTVPAAPLSVFHLALQLRTEKRLLTNLENAQYSCATLCS